jgi:hypothetical protein
MQPYNIVDMGSLLALQRISAASSISQIPIILSASAFFDLDMKDKIYLQSKINALMTGEPQQNNCIR